MVQYTQARPRREHGLNTSWPARGKQQEKKAEMALEQAAPNPPTLGTQGPLPVLTPCCTRVSTQATWLELSLDRVCGRLPLGAAGRWAS